MRTTKMNKKTFNLAFIFTILALGFGFGFVVSRSIVPQNVLSDTGSFSDISRFFSKKPTIALIEEGIGIIEKKHVDRNGLDRERLLYGAMSGMLKAIEDPYSVFLNPKDSKIFKDDVGGSFEGIGAEIGIRDDQLTVISPLKGNPAEKAGIKAGDRILKVDERDTSEISLDEAVQIIRGPRGTAVILTISREGEKKNLEISIVRDTIRIPIIDWEEKEGNIAYVTLYHFTETSIEDFENIAHEILASDSKKIILDLRNNPGGFLESAVAIAGWFTEPGSIIVKEDRGGGNGGREYKSSGSAAFADYPMVVLINKGSASASEILAGALRDHRAIALIGESTFGKGSVQELIGLSDGSNIKLTISKWLTPKGVSIQDNGLIPDIVVEMTQDIFDSRGDVQLERAIEAIRKL